MFSFFAATPQKTAEDDKHLTIISGLRAIKNKSFPCRNILISVIGALWNSEEFFWRESILPFKSGNYVGQKIKSFQFFP